MDTIELTLYLVGSDEDTARETFPFTDYTSAEGYAIDEYGAAALEAGEVTIYTVTATVDFTTIEPVTE